MCTATSRISPLLILPSFPWLLSSRDHLERFESHFVRRETSTCLVKIFPVTRIHNDCKDFIPRRIVQKESNPVYNLSKFNFECRMYREMLYIYIYIYIYHIVSSHVSSEMNIKKRECEKLFLYIIHIYNCNWIIYAHYYYNYKIVNSCLMKMLN